MAFTFEHLAVGQRSPDLRFEIRERPKQFPGYEPFNVRRQIRKAADSIHLHIAEGSTGQSNNQCARFLGYSFRSRVAVISGLFLARKKLYISEERLTCCYQQREVLVRMITQLRDRLT